MVTILSEADVTQLLTVESLLSPVEDALIKQGAGEVERPDRPHFPIGAGLESADPLGMGLTMPAYIHGEPYAVTKLVSVHEGNEARGLPTVQAQIALTDARTGRPVAYMAGTTITNARTGCIGGLAANYLASDPIRLAVIGAGAQARWQTRAIAATSTLEAVRIYSPSDSKHDCASDLREEGLPVTAAETAADAVEGATVVVTATTSTEPVFPAAALTDAELVVAVGAFDESMQELEPAVVDGATALFADVPEEAAATGDILPTAYSASDLHPLSDVFTGSTSRPAADGFVLVESVGSAVLDLAAATTVYQLAEAEGVGTTVSL
ncbi:ornithine cyclodeaminase family protein [Natronobeatus ordinarius]|uniref:ornithine cyclodeaminase family protein n=1 Tax=Natronobeatus ordinarius TaxID=2963433 RepID=UPI0020CBD291|nr:ornithine cyclodeaminase family protein [Natronobeatus ordinarius]